MAPLERAIIPAKPALFFLRHIGSSINKPSPVTVTVSGSANAGALTIPVTSLPAAIPRNSVLEFDRAAGGIVQVVVTEHADMGATSIDVESFHGAHGIGISASLAMSDFATWDTLYPDVGSENLDMQANAQTQDLQAVTHGSATSVNVTRRIVTGIAPALSRSGIFWDEPDGNGGYRAPQVVKDLINYAEGKGNFWGKYIIPNRAGERMITQEQYGQISGVSTPSPANGRQELSYTFNPQDHLLVSFSDEEGS